LEIITPGYSREEKQQYSFTNLFNITITMKFLYRQLSLILVLLFTAGISSQTQGQVQYGGIPASVEYALEQEHIPSRVLQLSPEKQTQNELLTATDHPGIPMHAGFAVNAGISPKQHGHWEVVDNQLHVWRIRVQVPGAQGVGLNFDAFSLPPQARMFVYDPQKNMVLGAFDHRNNNEAQVFSTHVIPGEEVIVEYQEPYQPGKAKLTNTLLHIESVIYLTNGGALELFSDEKSLGSSCHTQVNINCSEGDNWKDEKRGIARMLMRVGDNYSWCTGTLINNTAQDLRPYFLSADHCGEAASPQDMLYWQFYFNFERPGCSNQGTPPYNMVVGCDRRAHFKLLHGSDFKLLELRTTPPAEWRPYWNGWDRSANIAHSGVGIHHPRGDAKMIATYNLALTTASPTISQQPMAQNSAWEVRFSPTANGHSMTEPGSSGSPLFNSYGLVVGTLTGSASTCANPFLPSYYGKMSFHWNQNSSQAHHRLESFLDPLNTGQLTLAGIDPFVASYPPPGYLSATRQNPPEVNIEWHKPGSFPNKEGWYRYVSSSTHLAWPTPERATVFHAENFGLSYPMVLTRVSHVFTEHSSHPWPSSQFTYRIYATNGHTLLYESPVLTAAHQQDIQHTLAEPLVMDDYFFVAVRPVHSSGHPSSAMRLGNFGQGFSFNGSADNWNPYNTSDGSYTYLTSIYVEGQNGKNVKLQALPEALAHTANEITNDYEGKSLLLVNGDEQPDGYRLYRDNNQIFTTTGEMEMSFTEQITQEGFYHYFATALYGDIESLPSPSAYLLVTSPCGEPLAEWPYLEAFDEDFDNSCWLTHNTEATQWELLETLAYNDHNIAPYSGDQFYAIAPAAGTATDGWVITPAMDFSQVEGPALRFAFNGIFPPTDTPEFNHLAVWVSVGENAFKRMWNSHSHPLFSQGNGQAEWHHATINLSEFGGEDYVRIAFQYLGEEGAFAAIDNLEILEAQQIRRNLNITISPQNSGTATGAGQYLQGEVVNLVAKPNVARLFDAWMQGTTVLSHELSHQIIMPATHLTISARFISDPTNVEDLSTTSGMAQAFPNPTQGLLRLRFNEHLNQAGITIMNAQGQVVQQLQLQDIYQGHEQELNLGHLPRGMYFIAIRSQKQQQMLKVILAN
jgi:hypothetical protein